MVELLLDANISPATCEFLISELGLKAIHLSSLNSMKLSDQAIVHLAAEKGWGIVTFDLDFGQLFQRSVAPSFEVVLLRLTDQTVESVNCVLRGFFSRLKEIDSIKQTLAVVDDRRVRLIG